MRKTAFLLALLMILASPVSAQADTMRASQIYPVLYFNGTTATCGGFKKIARKTLTT